MFKSSYDVEIVDGDHVLLLSERGDHLLTGHAFAVVAELLQEAKPVREVIDEAARRVSAPEVYYALDRLEVLGVLRESRSALPLPVQAFWESAGVDPDGAADRIGRSRVVLRSLGGISATRVTAALEALGIATGEEGDLHVVLTDDYLRPELAQLNDELLRARQPWVLARPHASILWLGPLLLPYETACWECLAARMRAHRLIEGYVQARKNYAYPRAAVSGSLASTEMAAAALLATEVAKWLAGAPALSLKDTLLTLDLGTLVTERHAVVRRPQCQVCGGTNGHEPQPLRLASRRKTFTADGGHRAATPEATLARYSHHVSRLTGAVKGLSTPAGIDSAVVPLYFSGANAAKQDGSIDFLRNNFRGISGGKGKTDAQAKVSALCEAIERHSGIFDGSEPRIRATFESLGDAALHPNAAMGFSDAQYAHRHQVPATRSSRVPEPFDPLAAIDWSPLWSLTEQRFKYLPTAYCYFSYPLLPSQRFCWPDSNGCAAGNSPEEAILQGFFELAERDSVALWWYNRVRRPAVDLRSFEDPYFDTLTSYYASLGRGVHVLDITSDLGIPCFAAVSYRTGGGAEDITLGFGAHFDAKLGILRALTEANQFLPVVWRRHTEPEAAFQTNDEEVLDWLRTSSLASRPYLVPCETRPVAAAELANPQSDDLKDDVETCVALAKARGVEVLVLDQTRPDIGLPVVRVVAPGLRHFWARFAPGRLYDIPVQLGWLPEALAEETLNPKPVFF